MKFVVLTENLGKMYQGQIIQYRVRPLFNIPLNWVTEITSVKDKAYFIDEQRFGPYAFWHHQHHFTEIEGGVRMVDLLHYKIPFGILGSIAHRLFVKKRLEEIFNYRYSFLEKTFGKIS